MPNQVRAECTIANVADLAQVELDRHREAISRELCTIPPPVPACDVNFNRLLEDRSRVIDELQQLRRLRAAGDSPAAILEFCQASAYLSQDTKTLAEVVFGAQRSGGAG
jgi:hypothetical protein